MSEPARQRVGVLGGSFDPPHLGHVIVACEAAWQLGLDEVRLVPCGQPPHKPEGAGLPADLRLRLVEAAVAEHGGLQPWRIEIDRPGPSYTADTMEALAEQAPGATLWFILGADQLLGLAGWHQPERIVAVARLAAVARDGDEPAVPSIELTADARVDVVRVPRVDISSTDLRRRMAAGHPIGHLVPGPVARVLAQEGLVDRDENSPEHPEMNDLSA